jgi:hypothetical protein
MSVFDRVRQAVCGLHGHDNLLQFERERMFLKCVSCGFESPGWELKETPPTVVAQHQGIQQVQPASLVSAHLMDARRVA